MRLQINRSKNAESFYVVRSVYEKSSNVRRIGFVFSILAAGAGLRLGSALMRTRPQIT